MEDTVDEDDSVADPMTVMLQAQSASNIDELVNRFGGVDSNTMQVRPMVSLVDRVDASVPATPTAQERPTYAPHACYADGRSVSDTRELAL